MAKGSEKGLFTSKILNTAKNIPKSKILYTAHTLFSKNEKNCKKGLTRGFPCAILATSKAVTENQ